MNQIHYYKTKAALHFLAAASGSFVAASANRPEDAWAWAMLVVGSLGAGCVALKAYLSDATNIQL